MTPAMERMFNSALVDDVLETLPAWAREIIEDLHGERVNFARMRANGYFRDGIRKDVSNEYQESIEEYERLFRSEVAPLLKEIK